MGKTHRNNVPWCFCQTEGISILSNELIQKEMVRCSQTSKSRWKKHKNKDYLKHSIYSLLQYSWLNCICVFSLLNLSGTILPKLLGWHIIKRNNVHELNKATYNNYHFTFSTVGLLLDSHCYFQLINYLYPGNVNYILLSQSTYWLSADIYVSFDSLLCLAEVFKILCLKVCFTVFPCVGTNYTRSCQ